MTFKITASIYWQALRLLGKGLPVHRKERVPPLELTYAGAARREPQSGGSSGSGANR
jgi:DUF1365 family protein